MNSKCLMTIVWPQKKGVEFYYLYSFFKFQIYNIYKCVIYISVHSVQSLSRVWLFATPWTAACQVSLSITNSQSSLKPMSIELVMPSNHLILCCSLLLLPSVFSNIRVFSNASALRIRWTIYWSFSFNISPSKEHPGLISFRMDWLDLLAVQGTLKSLLQHHTVQKHPPKGNQFWIFIGRTDAEAETLILWLPDMKKWLNGKVPDAGKDGR